MTGSQFDVVGLGNAIVDVLTQAKDAFLEEQGLNKGAMTLIDEPEAERLYAAMGPATEASGGSAANTLAGIAQLGGRAAFIGRVRDDQLGKIFRHDIRAVGAHFETPASSEGASTARCMIFVTPDAQRTMCTFLGASVGFQPGDVDHDLIAASQVTYLEGYLWDSPAAKQAFVEAAETAKKAGRRVALSLSDAFCVDRHRDSFLELVEGYVDILFANETEISSLYQVESFDEALQAVRGHCEIAALTRSEKGSVVLAGDEVHVIDPLSLGPLVDTTGAGDLYAAGFLYGVTQGMNLAACGRLGSIAAGAVVTQMGPRPNQDLKALMAEHL